MGGWEVSRGPGRSAPGHGGLDGAAPPRNSDGGCTGKMVRHGLVILTPESKTIDNASNLFKKGKNIDGLTIG